MSSNPQVCATPTTPRWIACAVIKFKQARLAQRTERMASDHEVRGSSPLAGTVPRVRGTPAWAAGGTGRRARLRGVWGNPSGFESRAAHHPCFFVFGRGPVLRFAKYALAL